MPRDPGPAAEWLRHAQSNLDLARQPKPTRVLWDHLCFEAQQAAEKAVKAVLVYREIEFPPTHDIRQLLMLLDDRVRRSQSGCGRPPWRLRRTRCCCDIRESPHPPPRRRIAGLSD